MDIKELDELVEMYAEARNTYDDCMTEVKKVKELADVFEHKVHEALLAIGKDKYFVNGIGTVSLDKPKLSVRVPKGLTEIREFKAWLTLKFGIDVADAKLTVNSATLNKLYNDESKEAELKGIPFVSIPGIGEPTEYQKMKFKRV